MRFTNAWSDVLSQNMTLKTVIISLSVAFGLLTLLTVKMAFQEPIVIERSCYSKVAQKGNGQRSKEEIESFIRLSLSQRFDTNADPSLEIVSPTELAYRKQEQQELASKNMNQKVIVNSVQVNGSDIKVDSDRLISVGQVRSALSFPLTVSISSVTRSESNPYGLTVVRVSQTQKKDESQ